MAVVLSLNALSKGPIKSLSKISFHIHFKSKSSQSEYDKTAFILQNMNYLILNPRDLVLSDKVTPV